MSEKTITARINWEQGRSEPDPIACAYLKAIAAVPEAIKQALQA